MNDPHRGTGRTTRMLSAADVYRITVGSRPLIIVHQPQMIRFCLFISRDHGLLHQSRDFRTVQSAVQSGALRGRDVDSIFIDHAVWDSHHRTRYTDTLAEELSLMRKMKRHG